MNERDKATELEDILRKRNELDEIIDARFKRPATVLFTRYCRFHHFLLDPWRHRGSAHDPAPQ